MQLKVANLPLQYRFASVHCTSTNKLASLEATLVRNDHRVTHSLARVRCRATSVAKNAQAEWCEQSCRVAINVHVCPNQDSRDINKDRKKANQQKWKSAAPYHGA